MLGSGLSTSWAHPCQRRCWVVWQPAFLTAYCRTRRGPNARLTAEEWLKPPRAHLSEAGLGQVSEVFNGDSPNHPAAASLRRGVLRSSCVCSPNSASTRDPRLCLCNKPYVRNGPESGGAP